MEGFYRILIKTMYGNNPTKIHTDECCQIVKLIVGVFLIELGKSRVGVETAYGASDPRMKVGQYFWDAIQSHRVMAYFRDAGFHWHPSMAPSVVYHLFNHRSEKVGLDVLKANIQEQDNIMAKQSNDIKQMNYTLDSFQDKFKREKN